MKNYFFKTERLGFRNWIGNDEAIFVEMNQDKRVMEFFPSLLSSTETLAMIERIKKNINVDGFGFFAVDLLQTDSFIGFIGISRPRFESHFTPCIEIGWRLHPDFWNKGLATEGALACLRLAFKHFDKVYAFTAKQNLPSERVMQRIGMIKEGEFDHPLIAKTSPLRHHVIYVIQRPQDSLP